MHINRPRILLLQLPLFYPHTALIVFMESTQFAVPSSGENELQSYPELHTPEYGFIITLRDVSILKVYLEEFQDTDRPSQKKILRKVMGELYTLRPPDAVFDKREAMRVRVLITPQNCIN